MKTCNEDFTRNDLSEADKSRSHMLDVGAAYTNNNRLIKHQNDTYINTLSKEILHPYKGFYTWLSSPKALYTNRKVNNNIAVIAPTQHTM